MAENEKEIMISDEVVLARLAFGDRFYSHTCYECGQRQALFIVRRRYVGVCPECVQGRIDALERDLGGLPKDIQWFRAEAIRAVETYAQKERLALSVDWDLGAPCHNCRRFTLTKELRYPQVNPGDNVGYPHCPTCSAIVMGEKGSEGLSPWDGGSTSEEEDQE